MRAWLGWLGQVVAWLVILLVVAVLALAVVIPRLAGATPYSILTGSMRPHYPPGTLVVVKPVDPRLLRAGDVVTYQLHSGEPEVVTHRIVKVTTDLAGDPTFTTRGDANNTVDTPTVRPVQIRGRLWYAIPYVGRANQLLTGRQHQLLVLIASGALAGYAVAMFGSACRDRIRRKEDSA